MSREDVNVSNSKAGSQAGASREREMQEWARALGVAPGRLKRAVAVVGITPRRIREYLRRNP